MNKQQKKEVLKCINLLQENMSQTIILFGFSESIIQIAEKVNLELNQMEIAK